MHRLLGAATVVLLVLPLVLAAAECASTDKEKQPEEQLAQIEQELAEAALRRDITMLARCTADDFIGHNPAGERLTKADILAQLASPDAEIESLRHEEIQVRVFGNAAVATAITVVRGRYKGQDASGRFRYLRVWIKRGGQWQAVAAQSTALPEP